MYVVNIALDVPLYRTFSYLSSQKLELGQRVLVQFRNKQVIGFVWDESGLKVDIKSLKPILEVYPEVLPKDIYSLIKFTANYYHYPVGATIFSAIPKALKEAKIYQYKPKKAKAISLKTNNKTIKLNDEQQTVVDQVTLNLHNFYPCILYGITGSGKTEVYLELIENTIKQNLQVLVLVPEINLTPQMLERFSTRFDAKNMAVLTSHATAKERSDGYFRAQIGDCQIIIGTRLSVFTPFKNLGLIIIDEEHDQSFKQNDTLRYHARDLAIWRASQHKIPIVLGSATPSLESLYNFKMGRYQLFKLSSRAVTKAVLPQIELIDLNVYSANFGLTDKAIDQLHKNLKAKEFSLIFIN